MKRKNRLLLPGLALFTAALLPVSAAVATPQQAPTQQAVQDAKPAYDPVPALTRAAHPIRTTAATGSLHDLRPLTRMVGNATVVGAGEATHNSSDFFTLKHRMFRTLVQQKGFTTFALEAPWSTGLSLDRYINTGVGDPREIMRREFQGSYQFWNVQEYLDLIEWMRDYNKTHARKLHFVGDDLGYVGPETIDRVTAYVAKTRPALLPEVTRAYAGIRSTAEVTKWTEQYMEQPLAERIRLEAAARQVVVRVQSLPAGPERTWAVQHARAVWQVAKFYSFDLGGDEAAGPKAMRFRDQVMAENVIWWNRATAAKVFVSAHNGHVAYESSMPADYPKIQGAFLRDQLGKRYVSVGFTFDSGSFNALDTAKPQEPPRKWRIGPAAAGNNEFTLDRVPYRDYLVDLRKLPREARAWVAVPRLTRGIGTGYPWPDADVALSTSYDALIHLHHVTAADLLTQ